MSRPIQGSLFADAQKLKSAVIARRKDFEELFEGFTRLRAVSYVVSPDLLLEFFERRGYTELEVLVGENLSEPYRQALAQKGVETTERLAERVLSGELRVLVADRTIHTKLYLLSRPELCRVIMTSANLTETARQASRQINYAWYADLPPDHPWLDQVVEDYEAHCQRASLFMGDLKELLPQKDAAARREAIEVWLKGTAGGEEVQAETRRVLQEISRQSLEPSGAGREAVFTIKLPEAPSARKETERFLAPLGPLIAGQEARVSAPGYLRYVQENHGVPLLQVDAARRELRLGLDGAVRSLTEPLPEPDRTAAALEHLEAYFATVDSGQAPNPRFAKTSMFEALLYLFSAPFAHELMKVKRSRYGAIDSRGPRFLYIYGPSQNGKSTFLRFALKLIAGRPMEPLPGGEFAKRKIVAAASIGTAFPLAFDDVVLASRYALFEEVLKSYWELWWREDCVSPQIILSSNAYTLKEWAKSRVKRLDFDVHFVSTESGKERLAGLFKTESSLFKWFSFLYLELLARGLAPSDDELALAREAMKGLYERAGRPLPDYFPSQSIEKLYDPGRRAWLDLLERLGKAQARWDKDRATVEFSEDIQHYEIKEYEGYLPQVIKHRRRGKTLVIETPTEFKAWLYGTENGGRGWWGRLFGR